MPKASGGCHCGNIGVDLELTAAPETLQPRACDCDFCTKHRAAYVSDANGTLLIRIQDRHECAWYRQGSGAAEFLLCRKCGVLVGVLHRSGGGTYAAVNARALDGTTKFAADLPVSPQRLAADEKVQRWRTLWFSHVAIHDDGSQRLGLTH